VRGLRTLPARRQRFQNTVNPASSGTMPCRPRQALSTPHPRTLSRSGWREPDADPGRKATSIPPLPFKGRGDGVRGQKNPASPPSTLPEHRKSSILGHHPCPPAAGAFTPHHRPLAQVRGEGCQMRIPGEKQPPSPYSPLRGEGTVGGQKNPASPSSTLPGRRKSSILGHHAVPPAAGGIPAPHHRPLAPGSGERGARCGSRAKSNLHPPSPSRGEGTG
jgi:hypothetical protein